MDLIGTIVNFILHIDKELFFIVNTYGLWAYAVLFLIIFMETGFVVTPFLPGDSLLFAAGAIAAGSELNIIYVFLLLFAAAFLGDTVNYWIGHFVGPKIFKKESRFVKKEYLERAQIFYAKYGGRAIFLARFVPIIRTFAPFVAGIGKMDYKYFLLFNITGGFVWVSLFLFSGYFFGNLPFVKENFHLIVIVIVILSLIPLIFEKLKSNLRK